MKIFTNQKIWKKIVVTLLIIILFQFSIPERIQAADEDTGMGGKLLEPVLDLVIFLGDRNNERFTQFDNGTRGNFS